MQPKTRESTGTFDQRNLLNSALTLRVCQYSRCHDCYVTLSTRCLMGTMVFGGSKIWQKNLENFCTKTCQFIRKKHD